MLAAAAPAPNDLEGPCQQYQWSPSSAAIWSRCVASYLHASPPYPPGKPLDGASGNCWRQRSELLQCTREWAQLEDLLLEELGERIDHNRVHLQTHAP